MFHLQDPDCRGTSVKWGEWNHGKGQVEGLGIQLDYLHLQLKDLGQNFYFDVAVRDDRGEVFVFRCSTFQVRRIPLSVAKYLQREAEISSFSRFRSQTKPKVYPSSGDRPVLIHLPLTFPHSSSTLLTSWSTITLPLASLLAQIPSIGGPTPGRYTSVLGIEVHANCRLRRIWFSNDGKEADEWMARKGLMSELALYAAQTV